MIKSQPLVGVKLACNPVFTKLSQCELNFQVLFPFNDDNEYDEVGVKLAWNTVLTRLSQCELSFQVLIPFNDDDEYDKDYI